MLIYNTTFALEPAVEKEFLKWLRAEFIPSAMADGEYFISHELLRVMGADPSTPTYALHLRARGADDINLWYEDHGSRLFDTINTRWNGHAVFFSTTLEVCP